MAVQRYLYKPLVSIVMCCYNGRPFLQHSIQSIVKQTYTNFEVIFYDDGSIDDSFRYAKRKFKQYNINKKVRMFVHKENIGYGCTLRDAIIECRGDLVGILDVDDALLPISLEKMVKYHKDKPNASLIHSNRWMCDKNLKRLNTSKNRQLKSNESILELQSKFKCSHFKVFKKKLYDKTEGVDPTLIKAVDKDLNLKLEEVGDIIFVPDVLYLYRRHNNNISNCSKKFPNNLREKINRDRERMYENAYIRRQNKK